MSIKKLLSLTLALLMLTSSALAWGEKSAEDAYNAAIDLLQANKYAEAGEAFANIGNYEDAAKLSMYCYAIAAGESGLYSVAVSNLQSLGSFRDSSLLAIYYAALSYENAEDYEKAEDLLAGMTLYRDVASRLATYPDKIKARDAKKKETGNAAAYALAEQAEKNGNYITAYDAFVSLGDYQDSESRAATIQQEAMYAKGLAAVKEEKYATAYEIFAGLGDYKDSKDKASVLEVYKFMSLETIDDGILSSYFWWPVKEARYYTREGKYGLVNINENTIIKPEWDEIRNFTNGLAVAKKGDYYGIINTNGETVADYKYLEISEYDSGFFIAANLDESKSDKYSKHYQFALINTAGQVVNGWWTKIGDGYKESYKDDTITVYPPKFNDGVIKLYSSDNGYKFMNTSGNFITDKWYGAAYDFINGYAAVSDTSGWGYIDSDGNYVIPCQYGYATSFDGNGYAKVSLNDKWFVIDKTGTAVYVK